MNKGIPSKFVWTKMATHAGEPLENIVRRKELERQSGEGEFQDVFWWGVGESRGPAILIHLADQEPEILFSRMRSKAKPKDTDPGKCLIWTTYRICDPNKRERYVGQSLPVPENIMIQSGLEEGDTIGEKKFYALVCYGRRSLRLSKANLLYVANMKNLKEDGTEGATPGASQTTCVVKYSKDDKATGRPYFVELRANLVYPYFVELGRPIVLDNSRSRMLYEVGVEGKTVDDYRDVVRQIRG